MKHATINVNKEDFKFSIAHFTIFDQSHRERLHGHNYRVQAQLVASVNQNGLCFNYQEIKTLIRKICDSLDEYLILPANSPFITITEDHNNYLVKFNNEQMQFLKTDTLLLPITNTTVETFSHYLLERIIEHLPEINCETIEQLAVTVSSGDGQSGTAKWEK